MMELMLALQIVLRTCIRVVSLPYAFMCHVFISFLYPNLLGLMEHVNRRRISQFEKSRPNLLYGVLRYESLSASKDLVNFAIKPPESLLYSSLISTHLLSNAPNCSLFTKLPI